MKKVFLVVLTVLWAGPLLAQENYTLAATAGQVNNFVEPGRQTRNEQLCNSAGLALTCTTAELQAVRGFAGQVIYPDSLVGRQSFVRNDVCSPQIAGLRDERRRWDQEKAKINFEALDTAGKNAVCSALGLPNGCDPFP